MRNNILCCFVSSMASASFLSICVVGIGIGIGSGNWARLLEKKEEFAESGRNVMEIRLKVKAPIWMRDPKLGD